MSSLFQKSQPLAYEDGEIYAAAKDICLFVVYLLSCDDDVVRSRFTQLGCCVSTSPVSSRVDAIMRQNCVESRSPANCLTLRFLRPRHC